MILDKSENELNELFGLIRPSLGRVIRELDQDGYIIATGKHIKILNRKKLSDLLK
ncbi:MAG: winged helix-turn-helix domain-containing protein [Bacteroidales bacterium]|nr:winged helix-turn-helix domain-containing protein [Bacteroidales bacterium]